MLDTRGKIRRLQAPACNIKFENIKNQPRRLLTHIRTESRVAFFGPEAIGKEMD
jgi:hypothetical protein